MNIKSFKGLTWFWLVFALWPAGLLYLASQPTAALWCLCWMLAWAWFVYSKCSALDRGIAFIVISVLIAVVGREIVKPDEPEEVVEMIFQVMLLISGGVGGNFIAYGLLGRVTEKKSRTKSRPK